jgi:NAD-dependent dihydropyrimidine dehydrogenase PreA subunit
MNPSIPRDSVNWQPTIDTDACIGDRICLEFCKNGVFVWDEENQHPIVQSPLNCVIGCDSCAQQCPVEAITFPSREDLRRRLRELRTRMQPARHSVGGMDGTGEIESS